MKRKVIRQGHNTLTITLPSEWAKKFNVDAGHEINLDEVDGGLLLTTEKRDGDQKKVEIDISGMDIPTIWKHFMAVYREGYDEVKIKFDSKYELESPYKYITQHRFDSRYKKYKEKHSMSRVLQGFVDRFIGFEIVEHGKDYVVVKDMGEPTAKEFDNSLRRVFLLLKQMAEETLEAINKKDKSQLIMIHDIDINLDKFHDYCVRVLNKLENKCQKKITLLFSTLYLTEMLGDEFKDIAIHILSDFKDSQFAHLKPLIKFVSEQIDSYYDLFYKYDKEKVNLISKLDQETYFGTPDYFKKFGEDEKELFYHLRMVGRYINALTELRIEMEY